MATTNAETVTADLRRVIDGLAEAAALIDDAAQRTDGLAYLRQNLTEVRRLLDRVGVIVYYAGNAGRGRNLAVSGELTVPVALVAAVSVGVVFGGGSWLMTGLIGIGVFAVVAAVAFTFRATVLRRRAHRKELRDTPLAELIPSDYVMGDAVPVTDLKPSPVAHAEAQVLMATRISRDRSWISKVKLGQVTAAVVGVSKIRQVPLLRTAPALPAVKQLVADIDELVIELEQRPRNRRAAKYGIEHYRRARSGLVCAYRMLSDTTDLLTAHGQRIQVAPDVRQPAPKPGSPT